MGHQKKYMAGKNNKRQIKKLDPDFRSKIFGYAVEESRSWASACAVIYATGCRPAELVKGVKVSFDPVIESYCFEVQGAKCSEAMKRGIEERRIVIHESAMPSALLDYFITKMNGAAEIEISIKSAKSFGNQITRGSEAIWPFRVNHASPYSFRHAFATDMKNATGVDRKTIAACMGHQSTASQASYGRARKGGSGEPQRAITATTSRAVRDVSPLARFKKKSSIVRSLVNVSVPKVSQGSPGRSSPRMKI